MSITRAELSGKFSSREYQVYHRPGDYTDLKGMGQAKVLDLMKAGINVSPKTFLLITSFLLGKERAPGVIINGLGVYLHTGSPHFRNLFGSSLYLVNLDDDGSYWCPTENGLIKKSIPGWLARISSQLITSITLNYTEDMKTRDPRIWAVADIIDGNKRMRFGVTYQTDARPLEEVYRDIESIVCEVNRVYPDEPRPRLVYAPLPPPPPRTQVVPPRPNLSSTPPPLRSSIGVSSDVVTFGGQKRKGDHLESGINKRARIEQS